MLTFANDCLYIYFSVSTVSAPRSARFCSCSVSARSSMVCLLNWTRLQSTCLGSQSHTSHGGKAATIKTWCWAHYEDKSTQKVQRFGDNVPPFRQAVWMNQCLTNNIHLVRSWLFLVLIFCGLSWTLEVNKQFYQRHSDTTLFLLTIAVFVTGVWLMMLNFFPRLIDDGEYLLKLSQFCLKPHSTIVTAPVCVQILHICICKQVNCS